MAVETFSKVEFESALPKQANWQCLGLHKGEYCYLVTITDDIFIYIRSSIDGSGYSADTGEDSIRAYLVDKDCKPLGNKTQRWIQRILGWETRLSDMLRKLWNRAYQAGYCDKCNVPKVVNKVKDRKSKYYGKLFAICRQCNDGWKLIEE
jgi:hypothetical protein